MKLRSGREVYANCGIFGLEENEDGFIVTEGYDGCVSWPGDTLTGDDMREIADLMIDRWTRFRVSLQTE